MKNEATLLELFPLWKKGDVVDLKTFAEYLLVEEDLLSNCVFENGFDVTPLQVVRAIDAMVLEQREAGNAEAATDAAMPSPQSPACAATSCSEALDSSSCNDELPDQPDSHGSFTLTDPESQFCRNGKAKLEPSERKKKQKNM